MTKSADDLEHELEAYFAVKQRRAPKPLKLSPPTYKKRWRAPMTVAPEMWSTDGDRLDYDQKAFPSWARRDPAAPDAPSAAQVELTSKQASRAYYAAHANGGQMGDASKSLDMYRAALAKYPSLDWPAWDLAYRAAAVADREDYRRAAEQQQRAGKGTAEYKRWLERQRSGR